MMAPGGVHLHFETPGETLWAVIIGALLATVGGFVATLLERVVHRRERERNAALVFGGILSAMNVLVDVARGAMAQGEPYGPLTLRLLHAMRREIEAYERSRVQLYEMYDGQLRTRIHSLMVRLALSIDGISDATNQLHALTRETGVSAEGPPADVVANLQHQRDGAYRYILEAAAEIGPILVKLKPIAKQDFTLHDDLAGNPFREVGAGGRE